MENEGTRIVSFSNGRDATLFLSRTPTMEKVRTPRERAAVKKHVEKIKEDYVKLCDRYGIRVTSMVLRHLTSKRISLSGHCMGDLGVRILAITLTVSD